MLSVKAQELLSDSTSLPLSDFKQWGEYGSGLGSSAGPRARKHHGVRERLQGTLQGYTGYKVTKGWQNTTILEAG